VHAALVGACLVQHAALVRVCLVQHAALLLIFCTCNANAR
jgi:hypothetical protein